MQACGLVEYDECVMDLNPQFTSVAFSRGLGCRHERPVHGDLNYSCVPSAQQRRGEGNTAKTPPGRIGRE